MTTTLRCAYFVLQFLTSSTNMNGRRSALVSKRRTMLLLPQESKSSVFCWMYIGVAEAPSLEYGVYLNVQTLGEMLARHPPPPQERCVLCCYVGVSMNELSYLPLVQTKQSGQAADPRPKCCSSGGPTGRRISPENTDSLLPFNLKRIPLHVC